MIGAEGAGFTRRLMAALLTVPEFADPTFAFTDINQHKLDRVQQLAERDITDNNLPAKMVATTRLSISDTRTPTPAYLRYPPGGAQWKPSHRTD